MMFGHNQRLAPQSLFEGCKQECASPKAVDDFKSVLIIAYEQALEEGISPSTALAAVLDWVVIEFKRSAGLHHVEE
jgi:hypothetical protein